MLSEEVPEGFTVTGVQPVPGWQYEFERDRGTITAITWSGGKINPEEFQEFAFQAKTPENAGEFPWKAYQTYEDGSVVKWTGSPAAEEPASVVEVVSGDSESDEHGTEGKETRSHSEGTTETPTDTLPESGGSSAQEVAVYVGLGLGALVLVVALLVLRRRRSP